MKTLDTSKQSESNRSSAQSTPETGMEGVSVMPPPLQILSSGDEENPMETDDTPTNEREVVQQQQEREIDNAQENESEDREAIGEEQTDLIAQLQQAIEHGLEVAVYTNFVNEDSEHWTQSAADRFQQAATQFSGDHNAVGVRNGTLVVGTQAAMPATTIEQVTQHVRETVRLVNQVLGVEKKVDTLALFTHGLTDYLNFGGGNMVANDEETARNAMWRGRTATRGGATNREDVNVERRETVEGFAAELDSSLASDAKVVMYACLTGSNYSEDDVESTNRRARNEIRTDHESGGEGSFADQLRDRLTSSENGRNREVWGHRNTADTTANPRWRVFEGRQEEGSDASNPLFAERDRDSAGNSLFRGEQARQQIVRQIRNRVQNSDGLSEWVAREMPFAPDNCRPFMVREGRRRPRVNPLLITWFIQHRNEQVPS